MELLVEKSSTLVVPPIVDNPLIVAVISNNNTPQIVAVISNNTPPTKKNHCLLLELYNMNPTPESMNDIKNATTLINNKYSKVSKIL